MKKNINAQKGSVLVLTMMAVLILSIMVAGLLEVGNTEIYTTQNYELQKAAYYKAVEGIEEVRNLIVDPNIELSEISLIRRYPSYLEGPLLTDDVPSDGTTDYLNGMERAYITGTLEDIEDYYDYDSYGNEAPTPNAGAIKTISEILGFNVPPPKGVSLKSNIIFTGFDVSITARVKVGGRYAYSELNCGVYFVDPGGTYDI